MTLSIVPFDVRNAGIETFELRYAEYRSAVRALSRRRSRRTSRIRLVQ